MAGVKIILGEVISKTFDRIGLDQDKYERFIFFLNKLIHPNYFRLLPNNKRIINEFSKLFYNQSVIGGTWNESRWLGKRILKNPLDLFIYQEIIYEMRPDVIVETGTAFGGSALYFASILDLLNKGRVITVDINKPILPIHKRVTFLQGSSTDADIFNRVKKLIGKSKKVLVILDSDHKKSHVFRELEMYSKLVSRGSYLIVEDTNLNGNPVNEDFGPGPKEALGEFLKKNKQSFSANKQSFSANKQSFSTNKSFVPDKKREKFLVTHNPRGFLRRIR